MKSLSEDVMVSVCLCWCSGWCGREKNKRGQEKKKRHLPFDDVQVDGWHRANGLESHKLNPK